MLKQLKAIWEWRELSWLIAIYSMKNEKRTQAFGDVWHLLNPLIQMSIFYVMVEIIFNRPIENFALFFFCGFSMYQLYTKALSFGPALFVQNAGMIKTAPFPRIVVVMPVLIRALYEFGIQCFLLLGVMIIYNHWPDYRLIFFPVFLLVTLIGLAGLLLLLSIIGARFRDLANLMQHINRLLFYGSPVMYSVSFIPESFRDIYFLNPATVGIEIARACLMAGPGVSNFYIVYYGILCFLLFFVGMYVFIRNEWKISKYV